MASATRNPHLLEAERAIPQIARQVAARLGSPDGWTRQPRLRYERTPQRSIGCYGYVELLERDGIMFALWVEFGTATGNRDTPILAAAFTASKADASDLRKLARREKLAPRRYGVQHRDRARGYSGEPVLERDDYGVVSLSRYLDAGIYDVEAAIECFRRFFEDWNARLVALDAEASRPEGGVYYGTHKHRRREANNRKKKLAAFKREHGAIFCEVRGCGMNFLETYGVEAIHVHHEEPLARRARARVTELDELRVVCPNCHAVIHKTPTPARVASLKIRRARAASR